jgi:hypothetical protein
VNGRYPQMLVVWHHIFFASFLKYGVGYNIMVVFPPHQWQSFERNTTIFLQHVQ